MKRIDFEFLQFRLNKVFLDIIANQKNHNWLNTFCGKDMDHLNFTIQNQTFGPLDSSEATNYLTEFLN